MAAVTLVGAGRIGLPVAERLVAAGHCVEVVDLRADVKSAVDRAGASWGGSTLAQLPADRILVTVLPGSRELRELMLGSPADSEPAGLERLARDGTWIDLTSAAPDLAIDLAAAAGRHGVRYVDAGVGGGPQEAACGGLTLYVGGDSADLERVRPVLESFAAPGAIHHVGGHGAGCLVKLLINQIWFGQAVILAEAMLLATHAGVPAQHFSELLKSGPADSTFVRRHLPALVAGDYLPNFELARVVEELDSLARLADASETPWSVSRRVARVHRHALAHYGDAPGELLAVAWLEHLAGTALGQRPTP